MSEKPDIEKMKCPNCSGTNNLHQNNKVTITVPMTVNPNGSYHFDNNDCVTTHWDTSEPIKKGEFWCRSCGRDFDLPNAVQQEPESIELPTHKPEEKL